MTWPHINAVRDHFFESQSLKCFAMCAATWVDHDTDILTISWGKLAEPIRRNVDGKPPRKTAIRYMTDLERMGIFKLISHGKLGLVAFSVDKRVSHE